MFDLDGTLVDSRPAIEKAAQLAIRAVAPELAGHAVTAAIGPPIREMFRQVLGSTIDAATLDRLVSTFRRIYDDEVCLETPAYEGIPEVVARIAACGGAGFVLTNKPWLCANRILAHLGLDRQLREVVTPDAPAHPFTAKADALRDLLARHGLSPTEALAVGDSADDAAAAEACGVAFAAATYGYGGLHAGSRRNWLTIVQPRDILPLVAPHQTGAGRNHP